MLRIAHNNRLEHAPRLDRFRQFIKGIILERLARLVGKRSQSIDIDHANSIGRISLERYRCFPLDLAQQRGQAPAETGRSLLQGGGGRFLAHAAAFCRGSRPISSRASAI